MTDLGQVILADSGNDNIYDGAGNDTVFGGSGDDRFWAGAGADSYVGGEGTKDEVLYQNSGTGLVIDMTNAANSTGIAAGDTFDSIERVRGTNFADTIIASDGVDIWDAKGGDDLLIDGGGLTFMQGGAGADTFRFIAGDGQQDIIHDFEIGVDHIDLSLWGVTSFGQLSITPRSAADGTPLGGVIIDFGGESIRINNLNVADVALLTEDNFVFV